MNIIVMEKIYRYQMVSFDVLMHQKIIVKKKKKFLFCYHRRSMLNRHLVQSTNLSEEAPPTSKGSDSSPGSLMP